MGVHALALVLAAVTGAPSPSPSQSPSPTPAPTPAAALPFTVPAGWTQLPSGATRTTASVWEGPKASRQSFAVLSMPLPIPLKRAGSRQIKVCGLSAQVTSTTAGSGANRMTVQTETLMRGGYTDMLIYSRPVSAKPNARVGAELKNFCPAAGGKLPAMAPPAGWTVKPTFQLIGIWMGPSPMQTLILSKGPAMPSLKSALLEGSPKKTQKFGGGSIATSTHGGKLCGMPALFLSMRSKNSSFPLAIDGVATQSINVSYVLMYTHPTSVAASAAALESLQTLCAAPQAATP